MRPARILAGFGWCLACVWLWLASAGYGWLGLAWAGFGWLLLTLAGFGWLRETEQKGKGGRSVHVRLQNKFPSYIGSRLWRWRGWLGLALAGFGWRWLALAGFGWRWLALADHACP